MSILSKVVGLISRNPEVETPHFAVMSPLTEVPGELKIIRGLFDRGLSAFHLRRPHWTAARYKAWLEALPKDLRSRIVIHQFPQLVRKYGLGGFHLGVGMSANNFTGLSVPISGQSDSYESMLAFGKRCNRLILGPVFPPEKYDVTVPRRTIGEYAATADYWKRHGGVGEVLAFGGVTPTNIRQCRKHGFDGVVVVGAVWNASNPIAAFRNLKKKW